MALTALIAKSPQGVAFDNGYFKINQLTIDTLRKTLSVDLVAFASPAAREDYGDEKKAHAYKAFLLAKDAMIIAQNKFKELAEEEQTEKAQWQVSQAVADKMAAEKIYEEAGGVKPLWQQCFTFDLPEKTPKSIFAHAYDQIKKITINEADLIADLTKAKDA